MTRKAHGDNTFRADVAVWATKLKVRPTQVRLQTMTRKWASCSASGRLTFCRTLPHQPLDFCDYVIVHELLHLRIRNHGKLFESILRAHLRGNRWLDRQPLRQSSRRHK